MLPRSHACVQHALLSVPLGTSDDYYEEAREGQIISEGS